MTLKLLHTQVYIHKWLSSKWLSVTARCVYIHMWLSSTSMCAWVPLSSTCIGKLYMYRSPCVSCACVHIHMWLSHPRMWVWVRHCIHACAQLSEGDQCTQPCCAHVKTVLSSQEEPNVSAYDMLYVVCVYAKVCSHVAAMQPYVCVVTHGMQPYVIYTHWPRYAMQPYVWLTKLCSHVAHMFHSSCI